jgi:hypothetical protein
LIFNNNILQAQWVQANETIGSYVSCFTTKDTNIFAGTWGGVYLSGNHGLNWVLVDNGLFSFHVTSLVVCGNNIIASTSHLPGGVTGGVFRSTDNGTDWEHVNSDLEEISCLAVSGSNIFAGIASFGYKGVFRTTDNGKIWTLINNSMTDYHKVNCLVINDINIFAGTDNGIFISSNNDTDWVKLGLSNKDVFSLAVSGSNIFAGSSFDGIFFSSDNGTNWTQANNGLPTDTSVYCFAESGTNIFAGVGGNVFLSTNNGTTWKQMNDGLPYNYVLSLAVIGSNVFAGTYGTGVWKRPLSELTGLTLEEINIPKEFCLSQNYPNPFNPTTTINYSIVKEGNVKLIVYNTLGSKVVTLLNEYKQAGNYSVNFNADDLPSGIYFYRLEAGQFSQVKKMILLK